MRGLAILLASISALFLIHTAVFFVSPNYRAHLRDFKKQQGFAIKDEVVSGREDTSVKDEKFLDALTRIEDRLDSTQDSKAVTPTTVNVMIGTGKNLTMSGISSSSGALPLQNGIPPPLPSPPVVKEDIMLSGLFLSRIMPDISPKKVENSGIFDIRIFTNLEYTTYADGKLRIKFFAFKDPYEVVLVNLKLIDTVYKVNETDVFFGYTFFLNPLKPDGKIRFVIFLEGKAIGIEVPKTYYPKLKKLLLKK